MSKLIINKKDLKQNIKIIKEYAYKKVDDFGNKTRIIAVVKSNGYGLGIVEFTRYLAQNGIDFFAVSNVDEAITLRKNNIKEDIIMLSSTAVAKDMELLLENNIIITIGSKESGDVLDKIAQKRNIRVKVHIKIDTGFGRYGFLYNKRDEMIEAIKSWKNIDIDGVFSQFSLSFYKNDDYTKKQFDRFINCIEVLKMNDISTGMLHLCNSSAFIKFPSMHLNAVRIGSAFLGRISFKCDLKLKQIAYLSANVSEIKEIPKGYNIGYSNSYKTKADTKIAIIPSGYYDGFNVKCQKDMFKIKNKIRYVIRDIKDLFKKQELYVEIAGQKCKILGRVGMNSIIADITNKNVSIGDEVKIDVNPIYVDSSIKREYI